MKTHPLPPETPDSRVIYLGGPIYESNNNLVSGIINRLVKLEAVDKKKDITMIINSPGGVCMDGLAIIDTMDMIMPDVKTICVGQACSMGSIILCCGKKGKRFASEHSRIMIHQVRDVIFGKIKEIENDVAETKRIQSLLEGIYSKQTGKSIKIIRNDMAKEDLWMAPSDALRYGLIDGVLKA